MARDFITKNKDQKFMMYLHYLDPHGPYEPPEDFFHRFTNTSYPNPIAQYTYMRLHCAELIKEGFGPGDPRFENILLRYDGEIAHTDYAIGMVLDTLKESDILDNTIIVITADHGEEFLEHQFVEHGYTLYKETTHIPLIFWGKPITQPRRISERVSSVNILPTVLSLLNVPHDRRDFDGRPLFSMQNNSISFFPPAVPYIAELLVQHRNMLRAIVKDNWKYTAAVKWALPEDRLNLVRMDITEFEKDKKRHIDIWGAIIREELYDLSTDPEERFNIIGANTAKRDELRKILDQYENRCKTKHAGKIRKVWDEGPLSPEDKKKLKSLGYF
jgi:arylsulfatase A-like enzyme